MSDSEEDYSSSDFSSSDSSAKKKAAKKKASSKKKEDKKEKTKKDKKESKKKDKKEDKKEEKKESKKKEKKEEKPSSASKKDDSDLDDGPVERAPKNPDGTVWRNPLKFWTNKPKKINEVGAKCIMKPTKGSDCFCRTEDSITDTACFYWHKFDGDFNVLVKVKGNFNSPYDKAGIMLRQDDKNWVLSGLEYYGGKICLSTCITRGITDWSLAPLPDQKLAAEKGVWIAIKRQEGRVACFYSIDLQEWTQTRMGPFDADETLKVGVAAACPNGDPYKVVFERFGIQGM